MSLAPSPVWGLARPLAPTTVTPANRPGPILRRPRPPRGPRRVRILYATHPLPRHPDGAPRVRHQTKPVDVIAAAMGLYGVGHEAFVGHGRHPVVVECRMVAWAVCRQMTGASYPDIARASWRRAHTTVLTAVQRYELRAGLGATSVHRDAAGVPLWAMALRVVEVVQRAARAAEEVV